MARPDPKTWEAIIAHLRRHHPSMCRHWFDDIEPLEMSGGTIKLLVRELVQLRYLQRCCTAKFIEAAQAATGRLLAVCFVGEADLADEGSRNSEAPPTAAEITGDDDLCICPDYSFDHFVVGPRNRLAHAASVAVSKKPGKAYNPLFLHSGVGLGKTHLLQAICQAALGTDPALKIYYTSCNSFMNQFLEAVQAGQMSSFRHRFRNVDLLVIDDIHDLANRERTQEEFFHTFNTLYQAGKQIVLSSDAPPHEIPDLEERLVSRFSCGLVAHIDRPDFETRLEIIKSKSSLKNIHLPEEVVNYIAAKIDSNVRELEGAMNTIHGQALINGGIIDLELAKNAIGEPATSSSSLHPTIQSIIDTVARYYDVKLTELLSKRRHKSIALPRQVGMWLARKHTRYSLEEIGGYFGGRDHTTVMHAIRAVNSRRQGDATLDHDVSRLEEQVLNGSTPSPESPPNRPGASG